MKKFLSLLLTLTMVLSLVVLPARATPGEGETPETPQYTAGDVAPSIRVTKGQNTEVAGAVPKDTSLTFTAVTEGVTIKKNGNALQSPVFTYTWSGSVSGSSSTAQVNASGTAITATCTVAVKESSDAETAVYTFPAISKTVTVYDLDNAIEKVYFNRRPYTVTSGSATIFLGEGEALTGENAAKNTWQVKPKTGYNVPANSIKYEGSALKFKVGYGDGDPVDKSISISSGTFSDPTLAITKPTGISSNKVKTDQQVVFTATVAETGKSENTRYGWSIKKGAAEVASTTTGRTDNTFTWTPHEEGDYTVTCTLYEGDVVTSTVSQSLTVTVEKDNTKISKSFNATMAPNTKQTLSFTFTDKIDNKDQAVTLDDVRWSISSPNPATGATITPDSKEKKKAEFAIPANAAQSYTVKASFTYQNKPYEVEFVISTRTLSAKLSYGVQNGGYVDLATTSSYSYTSLAYLAQTAIREQVTGKSNVTVSSVTLASISGTTRGTLSNYSSYYRYNAPKSYIGADAVKITAYASDGNTYYVTLTIPVTPILNTSFEAVNAEQVTTNSTSYGSYKVYFPSTYARYYVVSSVNGSAPADWSSVNLGTAYSSTAPYPLTVNNLNYTGGQVTLYVVAQRYTTAGYNEYYGGAMTVYLQNNDIQYNGVAGETVKFSHSDFTKFMNAMNTASSTYYYEFQDVTFSYFNNTTQGALYYNNTAMSSGSYASSSYFNSATKITNLDYVSFAVNAKIPSSVKEIVVPFQMHVKQYYSRNGYPTASGQTVTLSGRVVISVVREDVKLTVAPGDAVKMDADAFLSYLRSSSNAYRNASIDYVTFEQTSSTNASSIYSGTLYSYYNSGYSVGSQVKSSDKFYYTTSYYNQNALSDVAFYASPYATTGSTVYIPFTIKPTYGSAVSGTLAVKIAQTMNFVDVKPGSVYYDAVKWAVNQKVTTGTGAYTFSPDKTCTRAEIVTFLYRAAGGSTQSSYYYTNPFTDVSSSMGSDFYNAILWAVNKGITTGTSKTTFSPNKTCTRAEIVTFLYRYAGNNATGYYSNPFTDVKQTTHAPYYNAILWAVGKGITTGTTPTTFSPDKTCTRGEAVTFLYRAIGK